MLRETDAAATNNFAREANISQALANLLLTRNIHAGDAADYLNPTLRRLLPEPFALRDMEKAVTRTYQAIVQGETIAILGDYDVDGSCAAALLAEFLTELGRPPLIHIPDRLREGYGPNTGALLALRSRGAQLVITVDCGATAEAPLSTAREAGLDTIVLDHHAVHSSGDGISSAISPGIHVNPNHPGDNSGLGYLCATGVTFLFAVALNRELRRSGWYSANGVAEPDLRRGLDLVGLATVCDIVPLVGVNRAIVRAAEIRLSKLERPGIRALALVAKAEPPFSPYHCGFVFGPRINAGGRVGRSSLGVELLTTRNEQDAAPLAEQLEVHNRERQALEAMHIREAIAQAAHHQEKSVFVLVDGEDWHPGIVGIVAGRLKDRFRKPAFAIASDGKIARGSARSVVGIDIGSAVRAAREAGVVETGGGHAMAAGFSLAANQIALFRDWLEQHFAAASGTVSEASDLWLDALISPAGATAELVDEIDRAGPFGAGNAEPLLAACDLRLSFADVVGQGHVRLRLQGGDGHTLPAIAFRAADTPLGQALLAARGGRIHVAGVLRANKWNGRTEAQLQIEDAAAVVAG